MKIVERLRESVARPRQVERPDVVCQVAELRRERDALRVRVGELTAALSARDAQIAELEGQKAALEERLRQQAHVLYGRKTEQSPPPKAATPESGVFGGPQRRGRGQRRGARGHGRRRYDGLPAVHVTHELPPEERVCAHCGLPTYVEVADEEVSTEIDWEVRIQRVVHHRRKYRRACRCPGGPRFLAAPGPAKLIPKGLFTPRFVAHLAVEKFLLARPLHRVVSALAVEGAPLAEGTLVGVLQRVAPLFEPLCEAICARNRQSPYLNVDETRWHRLWAVQAGAMWLWVFQGPDTTVYVLDESRGHEVVLRELGLSEGEATARVVTVVCDFMGAYDAACKRTAERVDLELARCWAHYRRLILDAGRACPDDRALQRWVAQWIEMVDDFFRLHRERKTAQAGAAAFTHADDLLRGCVMEMEEVRERQLRNRRLPKRARSLLTLGQTHWQELTRCLDDLTLPADNNAAERALRGAVVCRKNFYGSGAGWSEKGTTMFWTIFATAAQNGLNPLTFLTSYFTTCAQSGGPPDDLDGFLPWTDIARQRFGGAVAQAPPGRVPG